MDNSIKCEEQLLCVAGDRFEIIEENCNILVSPTKTIKITVHEQAQVIIKFVASALPLSVERHYVITLHEHAECHVFIEAFLNSSLKVTYEIQHVGVYAKSSFKARIKTVQENTCQIVTRQYHDAISTVSSVDVKGVAYDTSSMVYEGSIYLSKGARLSRANQQHKHLVMNSMAYIKSEPTIEALCHEVQCNHGAAIAHLNEDHLFYLMSKGFALEIAMQLLVESFLCY